MQLLLNPLRKRLFQEFSINKTKASIDMSKKEQRTYSYSVSLNYTTNHAQGQSHNFGLREAMIK